MRDSSTEIYGAFYDILNGNVTYGGNTIPVYSSIPGNNVQDYIYIGEQTQTDWGGFEDFATEETITIYCIVKELSNYPTLTKLQNISSQVYNLIKPSTRNEITLETFYTTGLHLESSFNDQQLTDSTIMHRKVMTWRYYVAENAITFDSVNATFDSTLITFDAA